MIQREWQTVQVITFTAGKDEYGQSRTQGSTSRNAEMVVKLYSQSNTSDIRYVNVEQIGITKDKTITDENQISINNVAYDVLYVIPSGKYNQILMRKH